MNKTVLMLTVMLASILVTSTAAKPRVRLSEASMLMGEREEDDLEPKTKRPVASKTKEKENTENDAGLYRGYMPHAYGWPHYPGIQKPVRPIANPWGLGLGAYGLPGAFGWGGWGRPGLFGWLF